MKIFPILFLLVSNGGWLFAQSSNTSSNPLFPRADQLLREKIAQGEFTGVAAGFSKGGEILWQAGGGYRNLEEKQPFTAATLTRVASIVKPMTAIAVLQLYEQKKIDLDLPIQTYLPDFPKKKEGEITVRQLLAHSSGIPAYKSDKEMNNTTHYPTLADAVNIFRDRDLLAEPGTAFNYTTYGYVLLGLIIERVSGMPYEEYMQQNILDKAGMTCTGIEHAGKEYPEKAVLYHKNDKGKIKRIDPTDLSDRIPGGGYYSCISDMLKFGQAVINNDLIQAGTLKLMLTDTGLKKEGNPYGLGWYLYGEHPQYGNVFGHTGAQLGTSAQLMILPDQEVTIIVLSNTSGAMGSASQLAVSLFDLAAGAE